jgi:hypothetical protein
MNAKTPSSVRVHGPSVATAVRPVLRRGDSVAPSAADVTTGDGGSDDDDDDDDDDDEEDEVVVAAAGSAGGGGGESECAALSADIFLGFVCGAKFRMRHTNFFFFPTRKRFACCAATLRLIAVAVDAEC